ncbi:MAG: type II secretion system GspH family protein [Lachnospiraceae bacterium]|nr:type II secretion system GspH family protein [Lachnospiraceae bacterium]
MPEHGYGRKKNNAGFTLVEMIAVMVIMVILLSLTAVGIMSWQDWSKMKELNAHAEDIFLAAQSQLSAYSASGSMEREVLETVSSNGVYDASVKLLESGEVSAITDPEGNSYEWNKIWKSDSADYQGTILSISSRPGDFEKFLNDEELGAGGRLLFKLVTSYISDRSILSNASILIEFSPEAAQVFAVCYSDTAESLGYDESAGVSVSDRRETTLNDIALGYYGVNTLSRPIRGKTDNTLAVEYESFELRNEEILDAVFAPDPEKIDLFGAGQDHHITLNFYDPDLDLGSDDEDKKIMSLEFDIKAAEPLPMGMKLAQGSGATPMKAVYYKDGEKVEKDGEETEFFVPVWSEITTSGVRVVRVALDAADVQAQSLTAARALGISEETALEEGQQEEAAKSFAQTYSFYRFGLDADRVYLGLVIEDNTTHEKSEEQFSCHKGTKTENKDGEYVSFATVDRDEDNAKAEYGIANGRHLYNLRFVEDYADRITDVVTGEEPQAGELANNTDWHKRYARSFKLTKNVDWHSFVAYQYRGGNAGENFFFDSYRGADTGIGLAGIETETVEFPGFRQLALGDSLSGEGKKVTNLTITTDANERFGVYGEEARLINMGSLMGGAEAEAQFNVQELERAKGRHPVGLFAYNHGTLRDLTLDKHKVFGAYKTGGFVGENYGTLAGLTLENTAKSASQPDRTESAFINKLIKLRLIVPFFYNNSNKAEGISYYMINYNENDPQRLSAYLTEELYGKNSSFVAGIHDVGGICGYQKYADTAVSSKVSYEKLENHAVVAGQEYVGGVIGRTIVNYSDSTAGYDTDRYDKRSGMTELSAAEFSGSINRGRVEALPVYDIGDGHNGGLNSNPPNTRSACYLGGICGMASDNTCTDGFAMSFDAENAAVIFRNCSSYWLYTDEEIDSLINGEEAGFDALFAQMRGSYYGGMTGYARRVLFENCSTAVEEGDAEAGHPFLFGNLYTGGFAGIAQACAFTQEGEEKTVNEINVIARHYAGGFMAVAGLPKKANNNPWANLHIYQYDGWNRGLQNPENGSNAWSNNRIADLKNTGLVYAFGAEGGQGDSDTNRACYGGICGFNAEDLENCDSLMSAYAKEVMLKLMETAAAVENGNAPYAGNYAGGLAGINSWRINHDPESSSLINTFVFGESRVGGAVGYVSIYESQDGNETRRQSVRNCYLVDAEGADLAPEGLDGFAGSYVRALKDCAGGVCGLLEWGSVLNSNERALDGDFVVRAADYAGGFVGFAPGKTNGLSCQYAGTVRAKDGGIQRVSAEGFFAGGFAGAVGRQANYNRNTSDMEKCVAAVTEVSAKYFAGGFAGAAILPQTSKDVSPEMAVPGSYFTVENAAMEVRAEAVAGGYYGYYEVCSGEFDAGVNMLYAKLWDKESDVIALLNALNALDPVEMRVSTLTYEQNDGRSRNGFPVNNLRINLPKDSVRTGSVTAQYYAGGLFGFVPDRQSIRISFEGSNNVYTTGDPIDDGYTYAGGIIGRTGSGMVLSACINRGLISSKADYLGNLCELNRGVIEDGYVGYVFPADANGKGYQGNHRFVGGLCGRNEGTIKGTFRGIRDYNGEYGRNSDVAGLEYAGGLCGVNAAVIFLPEHFVYQALGVESELYAGGICGLNSGSILCGVEAVSLIGRGDTEAALIKGRYSGFLAGRNEGIIGDTGGTVLTVECRAAALRAENTSGQAGAAGAFVGVNAGTIQNAVNRAAVDIPKGNAGGFAGQAENGSRFIVLKNEADIYADGIAAGIVAVTAGTVTVEGCSNDGTVHSATGQEFELSAG